MASIWPSDSERRELRSLAERIKRGDCVLVLGPRVAIRPNDPERRPLEELLASELLATSEPASGAKGRPDLRRVCEAHYREHRDRVDLELAVEDFYAREGIATTDFHRDLAHLPFRLCICASPDDLMFTAFQDAEKLPQRGHYSFKEDQRARLGAPSAESPLVYHLFGHHADPQSMVLTEGDLIDFVVSVVRGEPPLPDQVRSVLADPTASFLFLGFGFHNWYLRVLLKVLKVYEHRSKALAFEDAQFFDHPDCDQAVGFFSGERLIEFRPLRWEEFARQLRDVYQAAAPGSAKPVALRNVQAQVLANAPKAFISFASEDREAVDRLAEDLAARGIRIWQDSQDLKAGDNWNQVLLDVIANQVDYVVVVQTPAMMARVRRGVFHEEIAAALKQQTMMGELDGQQFRFLVPVMLGECQKLSSLQGIHAIDVGNPRGVEALVQSIRDDWDRRGIQQARGQAAA